MTATEPEMSTRLRVLTRLGFWGSLLAGLLLPWTIMLSVDIFVRHIPFARAWRSFSLHLFTPGYNFFLIGVLTAVPFVVLAVVILLHLGTAPVQHALVPRRRALGLACAGLGMLAHAGRTHAEVLIHPDAQGALAYLYLPIVLLAILPVGYGLGRILATMLLPRPSA
ncbi:MAG: hypothetical protein R3B37_06595 [Nitrospira sp.]|nr:hypothetical protein [Nitrospira sp.]